MYKILTYIILFIIPFCQVQAQSLFIPSDTLNKSRLHSTIAIGSITYTGFSIAFYQAWYKKYDRTHFHLFNDLGEWNQMDKAGHIHGAYFQGVIAYKGMRWVGLSEENSILTGILAGTLFQSTIEVMDGFSSKWGFSLSDMAANIIGTSTFAIQQKYWKEQRISIKVSSVPSAYSQETLYSSNGNGTTTLQNRANELYGKNYFERFLKDYNAQSYWASFDVHAFLPEGNGWPQWLNIAAGYGAENMYGGFNNTWTDSANTFTADSKLYPRYRQFYIGLDLNLPGLKPKNPFLKTLCSTLNVFRIPAPAIEINTQGEVVFHLFR